MIDYSGLDQLEAHAARIMETTDFAVLEGRSPVHFDLDALTGNPIVIESQPFIVNGDLVSGERTSDLGLWICDIAAKDGIDLSDIDVVGLSRAIVRQVRKRNIENGDPQNG